MNEKYKAVFASRRWAQVVAQMSDIDLCAVALLAVSNAAIGRPPRYYREAMAGITELLGLLPNPSAQELMAVMTGLRAQQKTIQNA